MMVSCVDQGLAAVFEEGWEKRTLLLNSSNPSSFASSATFVPFNPRLTIPLCLANSFNPIQSSNPQLPRSTISSPVLFALPLNSSSPRDPFPQEEKCGGSSTRRGLLLSLTSRRRARRERSGREDEVRRLCAAASFFNEGRVVREAGREVRVLLEATVRGVVSSEGGAGR